MGSSAAQADVRRTQPVAVGVHTHAAAMSTTKGLLKTYCNPEGEPADAV